MKGWRDGLRGTEGRRARRSAIPASLHPFIPLLFAACSLFARHEDVFIPIEDTFGEPVVFGADTSYRVAGAAYELYAPTRELLRELNREAERAAREFGRYFGEPTARLALVAAVDSAAAADTAALRARGLRVVTLRLPRPRRAERQPSAGRVPLAGAGGESPLPRLAARAWLRAYAFAGDTAAGAADSLARPGWPYWFDRALDVLFASTLAQEQRLAHLAARPDSVPPLPELFALPYPARPAGDSAALAAPDGPPADLARGGRVRRRADAPGRGGGRALTAAAERDFTRSAQGYAVLQFLAEREGPRFVGRLADRLLTGTPTPDALREARQVPTDLDALERELRLWLAASPARGPTRRVEPD